MNKACAAAAAVFLAVGAPLATVAPTATAAASATTAPPSWNSTTDYLAGDGASNAATDTWQYFAAPAHTHAPGSYARLTTHHDKGCGDTATAVEEWNTGGTAPSVLKNVDTTAAHSCGTATIPVSAFAAEPGSTSDAVVGWMSPVTAVLSVSGTLTDADSSCGNGVTWTLDHDASTIDHGVVANGGNQTLAQGTLASGADLDDVAVHAGDFLYLHVASGAGDDSTCDVTVTDMTVTQVAGQASRVAATPSATAGGPVLDIQWDDAVGNTGARVCLRRGTTADTDPASCRAHVDVTASGNSGTLPAVTSGHSYAVTVFGFGRHHGVRRYAQPASVVLHGTRAPLVAPKSAAAGAAFTVSTVLRDVATGNPLGGRHVSLWRRGVAKGSHWRLVGHATTGRGGKAHLRVHQSRADFYAWRFGGRRNHLMATVSTPVEVAVGP